MEFLNHFKIIESIIVFTVAFFVRLIITKALRKIQTKFGFQNSRILVTNKIITIPKIQPPILPEAAKIFPIPFNSCEPNVKTKPIMTNVIIPSIILFFYLYKYKQYFTHILIIEHKKTSVG